MRAILEDVRSSVSITANALPDGTRYNRDNVVATLAFQDGSIASVSYLANGDRSIPKEQFEVFCEGKVGQIGDFCTLELACDGKTKRTKARCDKGHACEIGLTLEPIRRGASPPSHSEELMEVSRRRSLSKKRSATGKFGFLAGPHMLRPGDEFKRRISDCRFVNLRSRSFQILSLKSTI